MSLNGHLRLKGHFSLVAHSPDIVELRHGVWNPTSFTVTDETKSGKLFEILRRLDGSRSPAEIAHETKASRAEVEAVIDHVLSLGVADSRPATALDFFLDSAVQPQTRIAPKPRPVRLLGDAELTRGLQAQLRAVLPEIDAEPMSPDDDAAAVLSDPDTGWLFDGLAFQERLASFASWRDQFVIFATKIVNPIQLRILNRVALELRIPWLHGTLDGPFIFVGPTYTPASGACYECFETRVLMNLREGASYQRYKAALAERRLRTGNIPVEPVLSGLLVSHLALEAINFLVTGASFTCQKVLAIYLPTLEFSINEVLKVPGCPACGPLAERDDKELYFDFQELLQTANADAHGPSH